MPFCTVYLRFIAILSEQKMDALAIKVDAFGIQPTFSFLVDSFLNF